jgi:hypothetical protein
MLRMAHRQPLSLQAKAKLGRWDPRMLNGHDGNVTPATKRFIRRGVAAGLVCTSTTGGTHAPNSFHYQRWHGKGRAADLAAPMTRVGLWRMKLFYRREYRREKANRGTQYSELFGPGRHYIKNGQRFPGQFPGHGNHVHGAPAGYR